VTANWWEATNSKPPGPIIMIGQSEIKQGTAVRSHSFLAYVGFAVPCTSLSKLLKNAGPKPFY
jgi:hypothetical protein